MGSLRRCGTQGVGDQIQVVRFCLLSPLSHLLALTYILKVQFCSVILSYIFKTESNCVAQVVLDLSILLLQSPGLQVCMLSSSLNWSWANVIAHWLCREGLCWLLVGTACALSYPTQIQRNIRDAFKASVALPFHAPAASSHPSPQLH